MRTLFSVIIVMLLMPVSAPGQTLALILYDDFSTTAFNPDKWIGSEGGTFGGRDARRIIQDGKFTLAYRGYGESTSDSGANSPRLRLNFSNPPAVSTIKVKARVDAVDLLGCVANPTLSLASARIAAYLFNSDTPVPGDHTNDVFATLRVGRTSDSPDPAGVLRVRSSLFHCADPGCFAGTTLDSDDLGTITLGQFATLSVRWDPANNRVLFKRDSTQVVSTYAVPDTSPPGSDLKRIEAALTVPHCTSPPRPTAAITAVFDNVFVNGSAASFARPSNAFLSRREGGN